MTWLVEVQGPGDNRPATVAVERDEGDALFDAEVYAASTPRLVKARRHGRRCWMLTTDDGAGVRYVRVRPVWDPERAE